MGMYGNGNFRAATRGETPNLAAAEAQEGIQRQAAKDRANSLRAQQMQAVAKMYNEGMGEENTPIADQFKEWFGVEETPVEELSQQEQLQELIRSLQANQSQQGY